MSMTCVSCYRVDPPIDYDSDPHGRFMRCGICYGVFLSESTARYIVHSLPVEYIALHHRYYQFLLELTAASGAPLDWYELKEGNI